MNEQLTTTSTLALFDTNKEQRAFFANDIVEAIDRGEISPLKVHMQVKAMEDIINILTNTDEKKNKHADTAKRYKDMLIQEAGRNGKKFEVHNAKFEEKEVGVKYDFSGCGDPVLAELAIKAEEANKALKERQDWLKKAPLSGVEILVGDELVKVYPPVKTSTTSIAVTLL